MKPHRRRAPTSPALRLRTLLGHTRDCHILRAHNGIRFGAPRSPHRRRLRDPRHILPSHSHETAHCSSGRGHNSDYILGGRNHGRTRRDPHQTNPRVCTRRERHSPGRTGLGPGVRQRTRDIGNARLHRDDNVPRLSTYLGLPLGSSLYLPSHRFPKLVR
jgi:hypothetical protein